LVLSCVMLRAGYAVLRVRVGELRAGKEWEEEVRKREEEGRRDEKR
jgi:hypothetical protein